MRVRRSIRRLVSSIAALTMLSSMIMFAPVMAPATGVEPPKAPFNFRVLGHSGGIFTSFASDGTTLFMVQGGSLLSFDLGVANNPMPEPAVTGTAASPIMFGDLYLDGNRAYVIGANEFAIFDISDRAKPRYRGLFTMDSAYTFTGFFAKGNYAYVGYEKYGSYGIKTVDVRNPLGPAYVTAVGIRLTDMQADVVGNQAFAVDGGGLDVLDISNPTYPRLAGELPASSVLDAAHDGTYLYVSTGNVGTGTGLLAVYSAVPVGVTSLPGTPVPGVEFTLMGSAPAGAGVAMDVANGSLWRATSTGLEYWDVGTPASPTLIDTDSISGVSLVAAIASDRAFVLQPGGDYSPTAVAGYEAFTSGKTDDIEYWNTSGTWGDSGVDLEGAYAYISSQEGLRVMDVSEPGTPTLKAVALTASPANDVVVGGGYAYVSADNGLYMYDVTDPTAPVFVDLYAIAGGFDRVARNGSTVFASAGRGLRLFDTSGADLSSVATWNALYTIWDMAVASHDRLVVTYGQAGRNESVAALLDVSNPAAPAVYNTHGLPGGMPSITVSGNYAYTGLTNPTYGGSAVKIFDLTYNRLDYKNYFGVDKWSALDVLAVNGELMTVGDRLTRWGVYAPSMPYLTGWYPVGGARMDAEGDLVAVSAPTQGVTFLKHQVVAMRAFGGNRFDTSIECSKQFASSEYVVLATGYNFPDALAGVPLAHHLNAPILLTDSNSIPPRVKAEITRLGATKAYILGGSGVIGSGVVADLQSLGIATGNIKRLQGTNRFETARAIAAELRALKGGGTVEKVFIATGENFPDALAASGIAAKSQAPIMLVEKHDVPTAIINALKAWRTTEVVLVGGEAVIGREVVNELVAAGIPRGNITRVSGSNRYDTAKKLADWALADGDASFDSNDLYVATGLNFPDALSCGVLSAGNSAPILLVDSGLPSETRQFLTGHADEIAEVTVVGGQSVVSTEIERWISAYSD